MKSLESGVRTALQLWETEREIDRHTDTERGQRETARDSERGATQKERKKERKKETGSIDGSVKKISNTFFLEVLLVAILNMFGQERLGSSWDGLGNPRDQLGKL